MLRITSDDTHRLYEIQSGDIIGTIPEIYLQPFTPGDMPNILKTIIEQKFEVTEKEGREFRRAYQLLTAEGFSVYDLAVKMYFFGKTQGIKEERKRAKKSKENACPK